MDDLNLKEFATKIFIWVFVVLVFGGLMTIILVKKFGSENISINKRIDKEQSLFVLVVNEDTKNISTYKKVLKENDIKYSILYSDRERYYDDFLIKLNLEKEDIIEPTIIYIEDKEAIAILNIEKKDELKDFLEYNITSGKGR